VKSLETTLDVELTEEMDSPPIDGGSAFGDSLELAGGRGLESPVLSLYMNASKPGDTLRISEITCACDSSSN
jgi:hypothetical protein